MTISNVFWSSSKNMKSPDYIEMDALFFNFWPAHPSGLLCAFLLIVRYLQDFSDGSLKPLAIELSCQ